jgi:hypothetical protein
MNSEILVDAVLIYCNDHVTADTFRDKIIRHLCTWSLYQLSTSSGQCLLQFMHCFE